MKTTLEEDKYYTPSIEEFHIGFEYQYFNHFGKNAFKWATEIYKGYNPLNDLIKSGTVRIKYLDKEDIESLDFISNSKNDGEFRGKKHIKLIGSKKETLCLSKCKNSQHIVIYVNADYGTDTYFQGVIKNKAELKRILNQIGYEAN